MDSNVLTPDQHEFFLTIFSDCREFYSSRARFDRDYKVAAKVSLDVLYDEWRYVNLTLSSGDLLVPRLFPNWPIESLSTPRGVQAYRQLVGLFSRLEKNVDPTSALTGFQTRVSSTRSRLPDPYVQTARNLISAWLGPVPALMDLPPRHGPGAVAEQLKPLEKVHNAVFFTQLEKVGGVSLLYLNRNHEECEPRPIKTFKHGITRVIAVPKDFRRPRIISAEPTTLMFLQQGVARYMMAILEANCPYLNFRDQTVNARLARDFESVATLDMSDASDLVSRRLVRQLFPREWADLLFSLRSHFAQMPDGTNVPLRAFAPMGSALCFPVESVCFAAIAVAVMVHIDNGKYWSYDKRKLVRVYGDDVIVPVDAAQAVMSVYRATGFVPNESKCCIRGRFRESCGAEWFDKEDVAVFRPRTLNPRDVRNSFRGVPSGTLPMVMYANRLYKMGFLCGAQWLASKCDFPVALGESESYANPNLSWPWPGKTRWNKGLQRCEQESTVVAQTTAPSFAGDCYAALFLGLACNWHSKQVHTPRSKPKRMWVLAAPLSER